MWGRYPLSDLECLSHQDSENIAHLSDSVVLSVLCLCIRLCLCICVPYSFFNSYYHKLSENVWVWGSRASRSEIYLDVTIAGQRQGKIGLLSQWTMEG